MNRITISSTKATFKFNVYGYSTNENEYTLIICHDQFPFRFSRPHIIKSEEENEEISFELVSVPSIASLRDLYDEYLSSIPDTDPKKTQIQRTFSEDLGKQFFIFKFDPAEIETYNTYVIEIFDRANRNNKIVSNEIQGLNLKENSFFELFSFYAMLIEAQPNEEHNMQNLFLKVCKIIFYCLVAVLMFYFVVILLMLIISLIALISMK
jgi:hypothetical protein